MRRNNPKQSPETTPGRGGGGGGGGVYETSNVCEERFRVRPRLHRTYQQYQDGLLCECDHQHHLRKGKISPK